MSAIFAQSQFFVNFLPQSCTGVITRFGKFHRVAHPGLVVYAPFVDAMTVVNNQTRVRKLDLNVKTSDDVAARVGVVVQWHVEPVNSARAVFSSECLDDQIAFHAEHVMGMAVSGTTLDDLFRARQDMVDRARSMMGGRLTACGVTVEHMLVEEIEAHPGVQATLTAMGCARVLGSSLKSKPSWLETADTANSKK